MNTHVIVGFLAAGLAFLVSGCGSAEKRDAKAIVSDIGRLNGLIGQYRQQHGAFPTGATGQVYAQLGVPPLADPWGTVYRISQPEGFPPEVRSAGPDKQFDNEDDVTMP